MSDFARVLVPLLNPNEYESNLAHLAVVEGQHVGKGDLLASFETTKSTLDLEADGEGYVRGLRFGESDIARAGDLFCYLASDLDSELPVEVSLPTAEPLQDGAVPAGLRITKPALALAEKTGIDLSSLPVGVLITEKSLQTQTALSGLNGDPASLIIYGGGGHCKSLIDLIRAEGLWQIAGIVDDRLAPGSDVMGVSVLGGGQILGLLRQRGIEYAVNAVGGIGDIAPRLEVFERLRAAGFAMPTVVHPRAYIEPSAIVEEGCQVFYAAYVGSEVKVGFGCIINTGAILSHECKLESYVNISPGAILAGAVTVGEKALVGMGVTVNLGVHIGVGARIGNSAVVKADVPDAARVHAGSVWPQS